MKNNQEILQQKVRHLHILQLNKAKMGIYTPAYIIIEIEDLEKEIEKLKNQKNNEKKNHCTFIIPTRPDIIGRKKEIERICISLKSKSNIIVIEGFGGVGKTTLAKEIAHISIENNLFNNVLWISCFENNDISLIIRYISKILNYKLIGESLTERKLEVYFLLKFMKLLIVFDNYELISDTNIDNFIENLPDDNKILITTRKQYSNPDIVIHLNGFDKNEAKFFIKKRIMELGFNNVLENNDNKIINDLYKITSGSPLVIQWALGQIKRGIPLESLKLSIEKARAQIFQDIFTNGWNNLSEKEKYLLKTLTIFKEPISYVQIKWMLNISDDELELLLTSLVGMFLIEHEISTGINNYFLHSLTKSLILSYFIENDLKIKIYLCASKYYLTNLSNSFGRTNWAAYESYDFIETHINNIFGVREWLYTNNEYSSVLDIQNLLSRFLYTRGYWDERLNFGLQCVECAKEIGNIHEQALCLAEDIGYTQLKKGDYNNAEKNIKLGIVFLKQCDDNLNIARSYIRLIMLSIENSSFIDTICYYDNAISYAFKIEIEKDRQRIIATINEHVAEAYYKQDNFNKADDYLKQSEKTFTEQNDKFRLSRVIYHMAMIQFQQGKFDKSKHLIEKCHEIASKIKRYEFLYLSDLMLANIEFKLLNYKVALLHLNNAKKGLLKLGYSTKIIEISNLKHAIVNQIQND